MPNVDLIFMIMNPMDCESVRAIFKQSENLATLAEEIQNSLIQRLNVLIKENKGSLEKQ